ncbi:MAG: hypothetical protein LLG04_11950 [Parachlamydia sp.]|nr:hypothetical protein [Parachlamydia sp.]
MYWSFKKTQFLALLMIFSALTYFSQTYSSDYRLIAREERGGGGGDRFQGGQGDRGRQSGDENRQYEGTYHPGQGSDSQYNDTGRSYSSQSRAAGAYGAGAMRGYNQGENNEEGNTQYVPVPSGQQPSSQPQQTYPYYQQPY